MAEELGINRNNIYRLEKGANDVTLRMMQRVATAYGTNLGEIFREGEAPERTPREFWPLLDVLRPLTPDQRERMVSNIASNLHFVSSIYGVATHANANNTGVTADENGNSASSETSRMQAKPSDELGMETKEAMRKSSAHDRVDNFIFTRGHEPEESIAASRGEARRTARKSR